MATENLHANRVVIASGKHEVVLPFSKLADMPGVVEKVRTFLLKALERQKGCSSLVLAIHRGGEDCDHE